MLKIDLISKLNSDKTLKSKYTKTEINKLKFWNCFVSEPDNFKLEDFRKMLHEGGDNEKIKIFDLLVYPGTVNIEMVLDKNNREDPVDKKD